MRVELENKNIPQGLSEQLQRLFYLRKKPQTFGEWFEDWPHGSCITQRENLIASNETPHRVQCEQQIFFVPCVLDAIMLAIIDQADMTLETTDPHNGRVIKLDIKSDGQVNITNERENLILAFGMANKNSRPLLECCCPYLNLFTSRESFDGWVEKNNNITVTALTIDEAQQLAMRWVNEMQTNISTGSKIG